jgi:ParB-like nuclease domain
VPRRGLPDTLTMRHDSHYVEALAASAGAPVGRMVAIDDIDPNPNQPRQVMGDLSELIASIAEKGVIEPLVVRQRGERFQIVAGERRYQAAVQVGLRELPVVIRDVDDTVRRGRGAPRARRPLRVYARRPGAAARQVADRDHRVPRVDRHPRGGPESVSAGRHFV